MQLKSMNSERMESSNAEFVMKFNFGKHFNSVWSVCAVSMEIVLLICARCDRKVLLFFLLSYWFWWFSSYSIRMHCAVHSHFVELEARALDYQLNVPTKSRIRWLCRQRARKLNAVFTTMSSSTFMQTVGSGENRDIY